MASVTKNKVCLKGVIGIPEVNSDNFTPEYSLRNFAKTRLAGLES